MHIINIYPTITLKAMRSIILHGGVGSSTEFNEALNKYARLALNYSDPLDAVVAAVKYMEDDPNFNAGTGSVMRLDGSIQMDAAVMTQEDFGAVIGIEYVKNPVQVAREIMENSPHKILFGDGALKFARIMGHPYYDPTTEKAIKRLEEVKKNLSTMDKFQKFEKISTDTVGAVANYDGKIAAAISTGGASPMLRGRVGDTPIPGSGIFVRGEYGAVATGTGEEIIRLTMTFSLYCARNDIEKEWERLSFNNQNPLGVIGFIGNRKFVFANKSMAVGTAEL